MCATLTTAQVPALTKWIKSTPASGLPTYQLHRAGLGQFTISGTFDGLLLTGWQLTVAVSLPYNATGEPYVLGTVKGAKSAAKLLAAAESFCNDRKLQLSVKQAVLDAVSVQHIG